MEARALPALSAPPVTTYTCNQQPDNNNYKEHLSAYKLSTAFKVTTGMLPPPGVEVGQSGHGALVEVKFLYPVERELASGVNNAGLELDGASYPVNNKINIITRCEPTLTWRYIPR